MEKEPFISIIILEPYYPDEKFIRCMKSYTNQSYKNYEIILIHWGKKKFNEIPKILKKNNVNVEIIKFFQCNFNPGYAKGNNLGVNKASAEFILISNPDVELSSDFLKKLMNSFQLLENRKNIDKIMVGPRICNYDGVIEYSRRNINFLGFSNIDISKTNKIRRTMVSCGCAFLIKKKYYLALKGFDENYFMYHEDIDFSIRASLIGIKQYIDNSIHLYHLRSDKEFTLTKFKYFYHERNRILMCLEHTKKKNKMLLINLFFEPFHLVFALMRGFLKERLKIYKYFIKKFKFIKKSVEKENNYFDRYYKIDGIFNEVNSNKLIIKLLNTVSKMLFLLYHHE